MSESLIKNENGLSELIVWADKNNSSATLFPRDKQKLLALTELSLIDCQLTEIPWSIGELKQLTLLNLNKNQLTELWNSGKAPWKKW